MRNSIIVIVIICSLDFFCATVKASDTRDLTLVLFENNSLIAKLFDVIIVRDSNCIQLESETISIFCKSDFTNSEPMYFFHIDTGVCFIDVKDTNLLGVSYYKGKQILWYFAIPKELSCHQTIDKICITSRIDCPIDDGIPATFCTYCYGVLAIQERIFGFCNDSLDCQYPIVIK